MGEVDKDKIDPGTAEDPSGGQFQRFPHFPPDPRVIIEAESLLKGKSVRINEVADVILEDPVTSLELLSAANKKFHANERPAIWSVRTALFRLGTENALLLLDDLLKRNASLTGPVRSEFEHLRLRARRVSLIARALATECAPQLTEECQTAGLVSEVGFMLALVRFKERYLKVLERAPQKGFAYHLEQDLRFDLGKFRLDYLGDRWFPPSLLFVFDLNISCKTESQANLRFIIEGSAELLEAIETNRFERYAPDVELPPKSSLRYLDWTEEGRENLYTTLVEVFGLKSRPAVVPEVESPKREPTLTPVADAPQTPVFFVETEVEFLQTTDTDLDRPLTHFSEKNQRILSSLRDCFNEEEDPDELVRSILRILTEDGPFLRASLLVFDRTTGSAQVLLPTGDAFLKKSTVPIRDPLSPIATSNTQIRSFNSEQITDELAPLGIAAYALSPLRFGENDRIALYADCGDAGVVPFESRRVFRVAVGLLNKVLEEDPLSLPLK